MNTLVSTNPADNYSVIGKVTISSSSEILEKVSAAQKAKITWKELSLQKRIALLKPICEEFTKRQEEIAQLITREIGKPITQSRNEIQWTIKEFQWFMDHVEFAIADEITYEDEKSIHKIVYEPFGVVAVITPWNFPFGVAIWGIIPNLLVGNTVVFKISEECPLAGKLIEEVFLNHHLPKGVFSEVYGAGDAGKQLSESDINFIWFTGSTRTGKSLYKTAADTFIKVMLELGGSNPGIVFEDVDAAKAAEIICNSRFQNCGQDCSAIKRLIVQESIADTLVSELKKTLASKRIGNPQNETTEISCLTAKRQRDLLKEQVADAVAKGAKIIAQLNVPNTLRGAFYPPAFLGNITKDMRVWREEVFGPVLPIVTFKTEQEAIVLANDTMYGLGAKILSRDIQRANRIALQIEAGTVEINEEDRWLSCNPFGSYKNSGIGLEHGTIGFRELCQVKVIATRNQEH